MCGEEWWRMMEECRRRGAGGRRRFKRTVLGTSTAPLTALCGLSLGVVYSHLFLSECGVVEDMGNVDNIHHGQIGEAPTVPTHMPQRCKYKNPSPDQNKKPLYSKNWRNMKICLAFYIKRRVCQSWFLTFCTM